ncbi:hypothetical protein ACFL0D_06165 [Thermoproteota archaeon]
MELISETDILRVLLRADPDGMSNTVISETLFREKDELTNLHSVKVVVSRKAKRLLEKNQVAKSGRKYRITDLGRGRLDKRSIVRATFLPSGNFPNITMSFAAPKVDRLIMERRDFVEALMKIDEAIGEAEGDVSIIINKKKVSRET